MIADMKYTHLLITSFPLRAFCNHFICLMLAGAMVTEANAQDTAYTRFVLDTLCSTTFAGRGYVRDGDALAADFIKKEFETMGLRAFEYNFYQDFSFPVNVFGGKMQVKVDGVSLKPGLHFLVSPHCSSAKGKFEVMSLDSTAWDSLLRFPNTYDGIISYSPFPVSTNKEFNTRVKAIAPKCFAANAWVQSKLTWGVSTETEACVIIELADSIMKTVPRYIEVAYDSKLKKHRTQNVIAYQKGSLHPDSFVVFTGHYDHLGMMGTEAIFRGANDNASGIGMLLQLAKHYARNPAPYSVAFIAFAGEEAGLMGSNYYVKYPPFPLQQIRCLLNLDLLGTGDEGITIVNGTEFPSLFARIERINFEQNLLPQIKKRGKAANSDHYPFSEKGVPALFLYTMGGITAYHDVKDNPETLPLTKFTDVYKLLRLFADEIMGIKNTSGRQ